MAKLTPEAVTQIFAARALGMPLRAIAQQHGVTEFTIRRALAGKANYAYAPALYARQRDVVEQSLVRARARRNAVICDAP